MTHLPSVPRNRFTSSAARHLSPIVLVTCASVLALAIGGRAPGLERPTYEPTREHPLAARLVQPPRRFPVVH